MSGTGKLIAERDLLAPFINDGLVDYGALQDSLDLQSIPGEIAAAQLSRSERDGQLAFYLNAYNLLVIYQVLQRLRENPNWPGVVTPMEQLRFFVLRKNIVAGRRLSLMALENRVIRRQFAEPRVHFALNCASLSCPPLSPTLFGADTLNSDLERLTRQFIQSEAVREVHSAPRVHLEVSRIFKWYRRDFSPSALEFIRRYRDVPRDAGLRFQAYDWRLNRDPQSAANAARKRSAA